MVKSSRVVWRLSLSIGLTLAVAASAHAQATRTWVSGVGDDANPCSRTAPCKTFAGAISKTAPAGEIDVLDPGGFGAVTITKSISIEAEGVIAGVLVSGTNGIVVSAGSSDVVVLRGLTFEGLGTGLSAVRFLTGGSLAIDNCTINHFAQGVDFEPSGASTLSVKNTTIRGSANGGVLIKPSGAGSALGFLDGITASGNLYGVHVEDNSTVAISSSVISGNSHNGLVVLSTAALARAAIDSSQLADNGTSGVISQGAMARARIANNTITGNGTGLSVASGGLIVSFGNNNVNGNGTDGSPTSTVLQE